MVRYRQPKSFLASLRIELFSTHHRLEPRQKRLQLSQQAVSSDCAFVRASATDQKRVAEHFPKPFERPAHSGLAQETARRRAGDVPLLQKCMQSEEQIQVHVP
jgi:hypothetical protein